MVRPLEFRDGRLLVLDQQRLPEQTHYIECSGWQEVARCIRELKVRGAPAIGIAAAFGLALEAQHSSASGYQELCRALEPAFQGLQGARPTAVNLPWALARMRRRLQASEGQPVQAVKEALLQEAQAIWQEDLQANQAIGRWGAAFIRDGDVVLTHCNAGALATGGWGTAIAPILVAHQEGRRIHVLVDETRPVLQGSRLTAWELQEAGIPYSIITDNAAGALMRLGEVDLVMVGTDRVAANGDVANKIGTYTVAVLAKEHQVPFYVAAPTSSIDLSTPTGEHIPIEERDPEEVLCFRGRRVAPPGARARNLAFDITPARYITALITELGALRPRDIRKLRLGRKALEGLRLR
jgi:methylthioribose-1-phosphate isomerase